MHIIYHLHIYQLVDIVLFPCFAYFFLVYVNNIAMSIYTQSYLDVCFKLSWLYAQGNGYFVGLAC